MGLCGTKSQIVSEPQYKVKQFIPGMKKNSIKTKNEKEEEKVIDQIKQQQTQQQNFKATPQNQLKQVNRKNKGSNIQSGEHIQSSNQDLSKNIHFSELNNVQISQEKKDRSLNQNENYKINESNYDLERNQGDISSRNEDEKRTLTYKKGHIIDRGSHGDVYQCLDLNTGQLYAVKTIRKNKEKYTLEKEILSLKQEIDEYKKLSHKNIVKYINTELDEDQMEINIILEFVSGGSIRQMLNKFGKFNEKLISIYMSQILQGLDYLHQNNVTHGDIKGGNILIDTDGTIKLTDFGTLKLYKQGAITFQNISMSYISNQHQNSMQQEQKLYWTAPEVKQNLFHNKFQQKFQKFEVDNLSWSSPSDKYIFYIN